ncbi:unnamed protein product, partial [Prorocentrum cordatum]
MCALFHRFVFENNREFLPKEQVAEYDRLRDPATKQRGKEKLINGIINACVPRNASYKSTPDVKSNVVFKMLRKTDTKSDATQNHGMEKFVMIGSRFAGNEDLFNKAVASKQCYLGDDGLYHIRETIEKKERKLEAEEHGQSATE